MSQVELKEGDKVFRKGTITEFTVHLLRGALYADAVAMQKLIAQRVDCNPALADHQFIVVDENDRVALFL